MMINVIKILCLCMFNTISYIFTVDYTETCII